MAATAQTKWDMPTAYPATNFHTENITQFVADVDRASGGKLKITVHANASLFKANEIKRAVQGNQAQAGEILLVNFENEDPFFGLDGVPFLATSYADAMKLYKASKQTLESKLAKQGIKLLYTVAWPPQGIYANRTLNSVADMKGLKWRAYSPATSRIAELVGAQPVTVQASELTQALATGVVDSYMSSGSTGYDTKTYESIKNFYDTQAWLPKNAVIVNQQAFDALDKATQDAVLKAARRCGDSRLESVGGKERLVPRPAEAKRHDHRQACAAAHVGSEESGRRDAARTGSRRPGPKARPRSTPIARCDDRIVPLVARERER